MLVGSLLVSTCLALIVGPGPLSALSRTPSMRRSCSMHWTDEREREMSQRAARPESIEPAQMRLSEIKAELNERQVDYSGCFDKEGMADLLVRARSGEISPPPPPPSAAASAEADLESIRPAVMQMRVSQIKAELKDRRIVSSDCFDKESLADRLVRARAGLISPPPPPPPPRTGAGKDGDFEFGAEFRQSEADAHMEDAFKAAGWTGEGTGEPSKVDNMRSPGLNRNFGDMPGSDFKKPYSRGS